MVLPTVLEVEQAVKKLKNNKAPGSVEILLEKLLKNGSRSVLEMLHNIVTLFWINETMLKEWNRKLISTMSLSQKRIAT